MEREISIKTVDGNRFDYRFVGDGSPYKNEYDWLVLKQDSVTRRFLINNIVSITEKVVDNEA